MASVLSVSACKSFSNVNYITPLYHSVSEIDIPHIKPIYNIRSEAQFRQDLLQIRSHFEFVNARQFKTAIENKSKKSIALLTFDDGLKECHSVIRPILKELSIPAVFFINKDFIQGKDVFYRYKVGTIISKLRKEESSHNKVNLVIDFLQGKKMFDLTIERSLMKMTSLDEYLINELIRLLNISNWEKEIYMSEKEVMELTNEGFNLGGHSMNHIEFSTMTKPEILDQIRGSVDYCQEKFGEEMRLFAFPFFDYNMPLSVFKSMFDEEKIDLSFGTSGLKSDDFYRSIQRLDMEDNYGDSKTFLKNALFTQGIRRILGKHKMRRFE